MRRIRLISIVVAVIVIGVLAVGIYRDREACYHGRRLSEWLVDYHAVEFSPKRFPNPEATREAAEHAVREIGTNAVPTLLAWLQEPNPLLKNRINSILRKQSVIRFRFDMEGEFDAWVGRVELASHGFVILGSNAIPSLVQLARSSELSKREQALDCLFMVDDGRKVALPAIVQMLQNTNREIRVGAAAYLWRTYPDEAEKAGVYEMFPDWKPGNTNNIKTNLPAAK